MSRALLDVNVLLALLDRDHIEHASARAWLTQEIVTGWASCPLTQNGFVRVISQPRYPGAISPTAGAERLGRATATRHHQFWSCDLSVLDEDIFDRTRLHGPRQVTDAYLLALAVARGGRFVTFDRSVPLNAVRDATPEHLVVL